MSTWKADNFFQIVQKYENGSPRIPEQDENLVNLGLLSTASLKICRVLFVLLIIAKVRSDLSDPSWLFFTN